MTDDTETHWLDAAGPGFRDCRRAAAWTDRWIDDWDEELDGSQCNEMADALIGAIELAKNIGYDTRQYNGGPAPDRAFLRQVGMTYANYLRTPHWRVVRRRAMLRSGGYCGVCHRQTYELDVHHLTYVRMGAEKDGDVQAICRPCHEVAHGLTEGRRR